MTDSRYLRLVLFCGLFAVPALTIAQTKMDADDSDVAALLQKIAYAHKEKISALEGKPGLFKACRSDKPNTSDQDASAACATASDWSANPSDAKEQILLKGCSYQHSGNPAWNACIRLANYYVKTGRSIEALAAARVPNAVTVDRPEESGRDAASISYQAYNALGNTEMARKELLDLCNNYGGAGTEGGSSCGILISLGESVDVDEANRKRQAWDAERRTEAHQRKADEAEDKAQKAERHQEIAGLVNGLADTAVNSYQQSQAEMAQARVNAEAIRLAQQNKGAGGNPTTSSSGGSSGSSTSSTSSTKPTAKSTATASDSSDSSSDASTADSSSSKPFNGISSTGGGYNPYSGQGASSSGASTSEQSGQWITTEIMVTCYSKSVAHAYITAVLVSSPGNPNCNGALIEFTNPDKTHSFYYGFAGVANERIEANTTKALSWSAPYFYKDRPNPPFAARVTIKYFAVF